MSSEDDIKKALNWAMDKIMLSPLLTSDIPKWVKQAYIESVPKEPIANQYWIIRVVLNTQTNYPIPEGQLTELVETILDEQLNDLMVIEIDAKVMACIATESNQQMTIEAQRVVMSEIANRSKGQT